MAAQLIILGPTEEVFGKCLDGISSGLITVMSRADFPVGERYPALSLASDTSRHSSALTSARRNPPHEQQPGDHGVRAAPARSL